MGSGSLWHFGNGGGAETFYITNININTIVIMLSPMQFLTYQKGKEQPMLVRMQGERDSSSLLLGMSTYPVFLENDMTIPQTLRFHSTSNSTS